MGWPMLAGSSRRRTQGTAAVAETAVRSNKMCLYVAVGVSVVRPHPGVVAARFGFVHAP